MPLLTRKDGGGDLFCQIYQDIEQKKINAGSMAKSLFPPITQPRSLIKSPQSIINSIQRRELGRPVTFSARSSTNVHHFYEEKQIEVQLVSQRCQSVLLEEENGPTSAEPTVVKLTDKGRSRRAWLPPLPTTRWTKFYIHKPHLAKVFMVEDMIVLQSKNSGRPRRSSPAFTERIYSFDANSFKFHALCRLRNSKLIVETKILNSSSQLLNIAGGGASSRHPIVLIFYGPNMIRAFDCITKNVVGELRLELIFDNTNLEEYKLLFVSEDKIYLQGTDISKHVKVIAIFDYPPNWTKLDIIHVRRLRFQLSVIDGYCFMHLSSKTVVSTWQSFMDRVDPYALSRNQSVVVRSLRVNYRGRIQEMPVHVRIIRLGTQCLGVIRMEIPLFYVQVEFGAQVYPLATGNESQKVYGFYNETSPGTNPITVAIQFPDSSPRLLVSEIREANYTVVNFKYDHVENERVFHTYITHPFSVGSAMAVIDMEWNKRLGLFALLTANATKFQVILYNASDLSEYKRLPLVRAWDREEEQQQEVAPNHENQDEHVQEDERNLRSDQQVSRHEHDDTGHEDAVHNDSDDEDTLIRECEILSFTSRCIIVSFRHTSNDRTPISIYAYPLMSESDSLK